MIATRYPNIEVQLTGNDGNAMSILGAVKRALSSSGVGRAEMDEFFDEATSGDYNHLLQVASTWVSVS